MAELLVCNAQRKAVYCEGVVASLGCSAAGYQARHARAIPKKGLEFRATRTHLGVNCYCASTASTYWAYKCLVERYSLLERMPFMVDGTVHMPLRETYSAYERQAFGNSEFIAQLKQDTK